MLLTILFLIIATIIGYKISYFFLEDRVKKFEFLPISIITGFTLTSYYILILSLLSKNLKIAIYSFLLFGGIFCLFLLFQYLKNNIKEKFSFFKKLSFKIILKTVKKAPWVEIFFLLLIILLFLDLSSKTLVFEDGSYKVAVAGYGDIPFHMAQVSYFIYNQPFELADPIYLGHKLTYPFLINLLSSSFYILNNNYLFSFHLPSFTLVISGIVLFYLLISKFIKRPLIRICSFLIFFLGSGLGFLKIINDSSLWVKESLGEMINYILHLPYPIAIFYNAVYPNQNNIWSSFLTMFLMHQRSFFFGFALGILCLFILYLAFRYKNNKIFYFSGILIGLLPLVHAHTFAALSIILAGIFVFSLIKKQKSLIINFIFTGIIILLISSFSLYFLTSEKINDSFVKLRLGWMTEKGTIGAVQYGGNHFFDWLSFMWQNFGLFLPLLVLAVIYLILKKKVLKQNQEIKISLIIGSVFLWTVLNLVQFQPWDYDSGKIFAYFLLLGSIILGCFFEQLKFKGVGVLIIILTFFIILSGVIDAFSRSSFASPYLHTIFNAEEQKTANWIIKNIPSKNNILTSSTHLNLVNSLAGKLVLIGYPGWLWTHGIQYQEREVDINRMFQGGEEVEKLFKKYKINYVMIGSKERYDHKANELFYDQNYPLIFQLNSIKIYRVTNNYGGLF